MRLICPNCGAQYEVPESVIPESGRDVQCSSCGNTWFQQHPLQASTAEAEDELATATTAWDDAETPATPPAPEQPQHAEPEPEPDHAADESAAPESTAPDSTAPDSTVSDSTDDEWQGFPDDPGLTDAPQASTRLVPDPEDPVSRLPDVDEDDYEEDPASDLPTPRRSLDTSVADMLREEAEREARARAAERSSGLESQPDLGLESGSAIRPAASSTATSTATGTNQQDRDAMRRMEEAQMRRARLKGDDPSMARVSPPASASTPPASDLPQQHIAAPNAAAQTRGPIIEDAQIAAAAAAAVAESRRGLLPDIEEINSSLRSTSDRRPARADDHDTPGKTSGTAPQQNAPARGFNRGFSVTLLIAMILLALYVFAPALAEALPAIAPTLDSYVAVVDDLRILLDAQVQNLSRWLADIAGSTG